MNSNCVTFLEPQSELAGEVEETATDHMKIREDLINKVNELRCNPAR